MEGRGGADGEHCGRHGVGCSWLGSDAVSSGVLDERTRTYYARWQATCQAYEQ